LIIRLLNKTGNIKRNKRNKKQAFAQNNNIKKTVGKMEKQIFTTRAELTGKMQELIKKGFTCFRVRVACNCKPQLLNPEINLTARQRNGVLVIEDETVKALFVRCKYCSPETNKQKK
jgi:hypothetical protein